MEYKIDDQVHPITYPEGTVGTIKDVTGICFLDTQEGRKTFIELCQSIS